MQKNHVHNRAAHPSNLIVLAIVSLSACGAASETQSDKAVSSQHAAAADRDASRADAAGRPAPVVDAGARSQMQSALPETDDGAPTWTNIYTFVFRSCRVQGCHGSGLAGIDMATKDRAYASLVGVASSPDRPCAQLGKQRIVPNDPDDSLLYLKLDINAPCGQQMPPGGQLSQSYRDRVRAWIVMGAQDN